MKKFHFMLWVSILVIFVVAGLWMVRMPGSSQKGPMPPLTPAEAEIEELLRKHVASLAGTIGERNTLRYAALQRAAQYITDSLEALGLRVWEQSYQADDKKVANIVAELSGTVRPEEIVIVGAHYDSQPGSPGADDNASGVAALLELARLFRDAKPGRTIRFVAFVNEEYPFFQTELMGSRVYATEAKKRNEKISAMLSLESIGYYSETAGSQKYPFPFSFIYPDTGNFIGFVGNFRSGSLLRRSVAAFRKASRFPSEGVIAPEFIAGIGWSDHWSFWQEAYPALMITDTAPFRNPHYHEPTDTPDRLDYGRMARVVAGLAQVVRELAK
ncbi:MAG TPA: M20/M25/M40 family metallo-hydrolase [Geobacteraceae bacterium]|nr:M20/M25/M40 family metallo-hydrolase [Geobacteraceae bacterium]